MADIKWDDAAIHDLLYSMDGPVGRYLLEKSMELDTIVRAAAPIQDRHNWSWGRNSSSYEPRSLGYLKGSVHPQMGYTQSGKLYGGVKAAYGPTLFLEKPADQLHHRIPFMSASLYAVTV